MLPRVNGEKGRKMAERKKGNDNRRLIPQTKESAPIRSAAPANGTQIE